ncbi:MAG: glycerol-3-phosphate acyltransferase [Lachnospiraceae bacterium]|nr:glycerol-3-phosphate acyltransferase [Lachnospiraceae bacterium]
MPVSVRIISLVIGYVCGLFLTGYFVGKSSGVDLTEHGSGNVGTTNTLRILGVPKGALTLLGDFLKGAIPAAIVYALFFRSQPEGVRLLMTYACFGAVLGHDFPIYMLKHGGKGIATSAAMVAICFPRALPLLLVTFVVLVFFTRYVSLGSITIAILFGVQVIMFAILGDLGYFNQYLIEAVLIAVITSALAVWKHKSNIERLLSGTENKFSLHPNK